VYIEGTFLTSEYTAGQAIKYAVRKSPKGRLTVDSQGERSPQHAARNSNVSRRYSEKYVVTTIDLNRRTLVRWLNYDWSTTQHEERGTQHDILMAGQQRRTQNA